MTRINIQEDAQIDGYTLIEGFPGVGLVGTLAAGYMVESKNMEQIGYLHSEKLQPLILIHDGKTQFPIRIYRDKEKKIVVLLSELIIPSKIVEEVSEELLRFIKKHKIKEVISLGGIAKPYQEKKNSMPEVQAIISKEELRDRLEKENISLVPEGLVVGLSGVLVAKTEKENIPAMILLAQSRKNIPDLKASAKLVEKLNKLVDIDISTKDLKEEAEKIEGRIKKIVGQTRKIQESYSKDNESPTMYG